MRVAQLKVEDFTRAKLLSEPPTVPTNLSPEDIELRDRLLREEADEYKEAALAGDLVGVADGLADQLYILLGTCVHHGIDIQAVFDEVHRSNMTKDTLDPVTRKGGKGANFERPRIAEILLIQSTGLAEQCAEEPRRLSRYERHQLAADNGVDTWEDYRGER